MQMEDHAPSAGTPAVGAEGGGDSADDDAHASAGALLGDYGAKGTRAKRTQKWDEMDVPASNPTVMNSFIDTCVDDITGRTRPNVPFYADHSERVKFSASSFPNAASMEDGGAAPSYIPLDSQGGDAPTSDDKMMLEGETFSKAVEDSTVYLKCPACGSTVCSTDVEYMFCPTFPRQFTPLCPTCKPRKESTSPL